MLDERNKRALEDLAVAWVLALRREYLQSPQCNVMKHWDQIQDRMRLAARTSGSADEWVTAVRRSLRLSAPSVDSSRCSDALVSEARDHAGGVEFLELIEARHAYLMARARVAAEEAKTAREGTAT
jgi:hypothetical protein